MCGRDYGGGTRAEVVAFRDTPNRQVNKLRFFVGLPSCRNCATGTAGGIPSMGPHYDFDRDLGTLRRVRHGHYRMDAATGTHDMRYYPKLPIGAEAVWDTAAMSVGSVDSTGVILHLQCVIYWLALRISRSLDHRSGLLPGGVSIGTTSSPYVQACVLALYSFEQLA
jgi:hypothetical protein